MRTADLAQNAWFVTQGGKYSSPEYVLVVSLDKHRSTGHSIEKVATGHDRRRYGQTDGLLVIEAGTEYNDGGKEIEEWVLTEGRSRPSVMAAAEEFADRLRAALDAGPVRKDDLGELADLPGLYVRVLPARRFVGSLVETIRMKRRAKVAAQERAQRDQRAQEKREARWNAVADRLRPLISKNPEPGYYGYNKDHDKVTLTVADMEALLSRIEQASQQD